MKIVLAKAPPSKSNWKSTGALDINQYPLNPSNSLNEPAHDPSTYIADSPSDNIEVTTPSKDSGSASSTP